MTPTFIDPLLRGSSHLRSRIGIGGFLTCAVSLGLLAGCTVSFDPGNTSDSGSDPADADPVATASVSSDTDAGSRALPQNDGDDGVTRSQTDEDLPTRSDYEALVEGERACESQSLEITGANEVIQVTGDCSELIILGGGNVVLAENVGTLEVTGANHTVFLQSLDHLEVTGGGNLVLWQSGSPTQEVSGHNNIYQQGE